MADFGSKVSSGAKAQTPEGDERLTLIGPFMSYGHKGHRDLLYGADTSTRFCGLSSRRLGLAFGEGSGAPPLPPGTYIGPI